ncbi:hypothetical protein SAY87_028493 [Trapa incisa]|uniref:pectinesterase n=1 Tax=Trapa incisa TaxID=236973 RepID=A0AAN7KXX7_9MYRT|nr:hypothetical protein SAY87_028493 [Trapa incisa]
MDTIKSFKGYGKVDEAEERAFRQKTRRRIIILGFSFVVLVLVIVGAVVGTIVQRNRSDSDDDAPASPAAGLTPAASLKTVCSVTQYPDSCFSSISSYGNANTTDPEQLFKLSLQVAIQEVYRFADYVSSTAEKINGDNKTKSALNVCSTVIDDAASQLNDSVSLLEVNSAEKLLSDARINDMRTWLSSTITNLDTCLDSLEEMNSTLHDDYKARVQNSTEFASNSLAIVARILSLLANLNIPIHRKLLGSGESSEFPTWHRPADRRLLQDNSIVPNVTVAADGTGDYRTIKEAVGRVPKKGTSRFIIYVKAGTYTENIVIDKSKWNVMIYGDGKERTIISGSLNFVDGTPTFGTATFAVAGKGFIAKNMKFINTAGPEKHQAVAFRSGSDMSVMYQCSFDAYQDTLYAHSNRQFYLECDITGTIDFIFGNSAAVFQRCQIMPRQPMPNQFNTITAQGKKDPNQNTGLSIQKCTLLPFSSNLTAQTYLGRPWKDYSTTVIMQSSIGGFLNPKGWIEWVSGTDPPRTINYGEYQNTGPGASTAQRVTWTGYKPALTASQAGKFTVESFIQGRFRGVQVSDRKKGKTYCWCLTIPSPASQHYRPRLVARQAESPARPFTTTVPQSSYQTTTSALLPLSRGRFTAIVSQFLNSSPLLRILVHPLLLFLSTYMFTVSEPVWFYSMGVTARELDLSDEEELPQGQKNEDFGSESESESDQEDGEVKLLEPSKNSVYNTDGLLDKLGDISWPQNLPWTDKLSIVFEQAQEVDVNDDLARELAFYTQALEGTRQAFGELQKMGIAFLRPSNYYAEMVKSDSHMEKVKGQLLAEKKNIEEAEERKKAREAKKLAKEVQAQKQKERAKQKKEDIESVKKWRKQRQKSGFSGKGDDLPFDFEDGKTFERSSKKRPGVSPGDRSGGKAGFGGKKGIENSRIKKREFRDSKFGSGGKKGMKKQNTAATTNDIRDFNKSESGTNKRKR